jgi:hypothetical protein
MTSTMKTTYRVTDKYSGALQYGAREWSFNESDGKFLAEAEPDAPSPVLGPAMRYPFATLDTELELTTREKVLLGAGLVLGVAGVLALTLGVRDMVVFAWSLLR